MFHISVKFGYKKTLTFILIKKLISYGIIYETNKCIFIEMVICMYIDCKNESRHGNALVFINFQGAKI